MSSEALASLTEMYTDSEGDEAAPRYEPKKRSQSKMVGKSVLKKGIKGRTTLVSYVDDTVISEDEEKSGPIPGYVYRSVAGGASTSKDAPSVEQQLPDYSDVDMPPEPKGICSVQLQQKIADLTEKMKTRSADMNQIIQQRKAFRNPSIYEKLIQFCNINEFGTNYEPKIYDPLKWSNNSYYDELAKQQKQDMDQREKDRREKSINKRLQVEFVIGTKKNSNGAGSSSNAMDEGVKRKKKSDQNGFFTNNGVVKPPPGIVALTPSVTGTKRTVISAFGSLSKKPKM